MAANVNSIQGYNRNIPTAVNKVFAAYGNDVIDVDAGTGYSLNLTNVAEATMSPFLESIFYQDYSRVPLTFNGSRWSGRHVNNAPIAKHMLPFKTKMYLGYCALNYNSVAGDSPEDQDGNKLVYPNRVINSDLPTASGSASTAEDLKWGLEWGENGKVAAESDMFAIASPRGRQDFIFNNIKVGDPLFITKSTNGTLNGKYVILEIKSNFTVRVDKKFPKADTSIEFWAGSNWFDVPGKGNDFIMGLEENDDNMLVFRQFDLWRYNQTSLKRVKAAPGATSKDSIISIGSYTFYFHGSNTNTRKTGIWMYNQLNSKLITRGLQAYIDGIPTSFYDNVIAWSEGSKLKMFVGTITNNDRDISMTNAVITYDTEGGQLDIGPIADVITSAGDFVESGAEKVLIGTSDDQVMETPSGNTFNTAAIPWSVSTGTRYPSGSEIINRFPRVQIISRGGRGIQVFYKLIGTPQDDDQQWNPLGDLEHNNQELTIPTRHQRGRGINIKLANSDGNANNFVIQKISIFYVPEILRNVT